MSHVKTPIYMDHHATTPVDPRVVAVMLPCFSEEFGNASSRSHAFGLRAEELVDEARGQVAEFVGARKQEIIFTSGATESNNLAIKGVWESYRSKGGHIITQVTEHKAVLDTCKYLESQGAQVTYLPVDKTGTVSIDDVKSALRPETVLISIMFANNEIGTLQPIRELGKLAKEHGIVFHVDGVQATGKLPLNMNEYGIDLFSFSAHKMYGPKGIGALYVRRNDPYVRLSPMMRGGGHERGIRSGTLNVPGIVGLGKACSVASTEMSEEVSRVKSLRDRLEQGLKSGLEDVFLNGHPTERIPNNLNVSFAGVDAESLLSGLTDDMAVSSSSACSSGGLEPSYVLKAVGTRPDLLHTAIRFGLGRFNTAEEVDYVIDRVISVVRKLRAVSPFYGDSAKNK
ncbi:MAG: IscS subfamily cysteine desulfurase [Candidatus Omnitrophota bacterium]|nr:IscS subfamily cysteine desulfurase [Candidatus Omnitrophota bacterium]